MSDPESITLVDQPSRPVPLVAWLQLCRIPNVFTAMADVLLGFLLTHAGLEPWWLFALLLASSSLIYTAGMVLNDVFDVAVDRLERPLRPLPSGRIPLRLALHAGGVMLGAGVALAWAASALTGQATSGAVATLLALAVLAYDRLLKRTPAAPAIMGCCRALNVLLGASAAADPWHPMLWAVATGLGIYIGGVTWYARCEARRSQPAVLSAACVVMAGGMALLAWFPSWADAALPEVSWPRYALDIGPRWYVLWGALGVIVLRRCLAAAFDPTPQAVQAAVKHCLLSLIVLDAAACFAVRGLAWACVILVLLAPALLLGRWVYST